MADWSPERCFGAIIPVYTEYMGNGHGQDVLATGCSIGIDGRLVAVKVAGRLHRLVKANAGSGLLLTRAWCVALWTAAGE
jgi:hypothetical protein